MAPEKDCQVLSWVLIVCLISLGNLVGFPADEVVGGALGPLLRLWWEKVQHGGLLAKNSKTRAGTLWAACLEYPGLNRLSRFLRSGLFSTGLVGF